MDVLAVDPDVPYRKLIRQMHEGSEAGGQAGPAGPPARWPARDTAASVYWSLPAAKGDIARDKDAMRDSTRQIADHVCGIENQLLLDIAMDMDALISPLAKVNVGEMHKNCRHLVLTMLNEQLPQLVRSSL